MSKTVLIDNGHGRETPGKKSPDGKLQEYAWAREIAKRVVNALCDKGVDARLLTPEDTDIRLGERVKRANAVCDKMGAGNVMLVRQVVVKTVPLPSLSIEPPSSTKSKWSS